MYCYEYDNISRQINTLRNEVNDCKCRVRKIEKKQTKAIDEVVKCVGPYKVVHFVNEPMNTLVLAENVYKYPFVVKQPKRKKVDSITICRTYLL